MADRGRENRDGALRAVGDERHRQEALKAEGKFEFTCADKGVTNTERMTILVEEVGEVAREVLTQEDYRLVYDFEGSRDALCKELIQVAAVAVAWVEGLQ